MKEINGQKELLLQKLSAISESLEIIDAAIASVHTGLTMELINGKMKEIEELDNSLIQLERAADGQLDKGNKKQEGLNVALA
ncbi:hypothetical protein [Bacillus sp. FJAT-27445]|uniref:hypothetical protein n=1 Tax=Bacillus sp. FJAT-27445 TaxID=1679166 RepID=UPI000743295E|nr:hypothetical protein [Bacillus sp. FJAT-27445]